MTKFIPDLLESHKMTKDNVMSPKDKSSLFLATSLCDCIEDKNLVHLSILLNKKDADPNICIPYRGTTPFHIVVADDSEDFAIEATKLFLLHGANPNVRSEFGEAPIHVAAALGRLEILKLLLCNGGDPLCMDEKGRNPFHFAFKSKHQPVLSFLLEHCKEKNTSDDEDHFEMKLEKVLVNTSNVVAEYMPCEEEDSSKYTLALSEMNNASFRSDSENPKQKYDELADNFDCGKPKIHRPKLSLLTSDRTHGTSLVTSDRTCDSNPEAKQAQNSGATSILVTQAENLLNSMRLSEKNSWDSLINLNISPEVKNNKYYTSNLNKTLNSTVMNFKKNLEVESFMDSSILQQIEESNYEQPYLIEEAFKYRDNEENVTLLERRLCVASAREGSDTSLYHSCEMDTWYPLNSRKGPSDLPPYLLRQRLINQGQNPGPITPTTYSVYLKRLIGLERKKQASTPRYLESELCTAGTTDFFSLDWIQELKAFQRLEEEMAREFVRPDFKKKWRGGIEKTSFNYLLLDPRILRCLAQRAYKLNPEEKWRSFLSAIFYVGKGKRSRPYAHLYDAVRVWTSGKKIPTREKKIKHILDIWNEGQGVVVLHVFQNIMSAEAHTREALMIDALCLDSIDNCKSGEYYGFASTWLPSTKRAIGRYLLYKCMEMLMLEGERQIFPEHI